MLDHICRPGLSYRTHSARRKPARLIFHEASEPGASLGTGAGHPPQRFLPSFPLRAITQEEFETKKQEILNQM
jgi:hypothetical protein